MWCGDLSCPAWRMILKNGVIPIPPARNTAGFSDLRCNTNEPPGWSILTCRPGEALLSTALKSCVSHPRGDHEIIIEGRTGDRKRPRIAFCIGLRRVRQGQIHRLTCLELKI